MTIVVIFIVFLAAGLVWVVLLMLKESRSKKTALTQLEEQRQTGAAQSQELLQVKKGLEQQKTRAAELQKLVIRKEEQLKMAQREVRQSIKDFFDQTQLKDVMTCKVVTLSEEASFSEVPEKMEQYHIRHLPIVDDDGRLTGLITQRMLYKIQSPRRLVDGQWYYDREMLNDIILKHVMVKDVYTLYPQSPLGTALLKMVQSKFGCIPVVDEEYRLVGVVTRKDLLKIAAKIYRSP